MIKWLGKEVHTMNYYLGIDGGGTKTKVAVIDEDKNLIYMGTSGPSSIDTVDQVTTLKHIKEALSGFTNAHQDITFSSVFCGLGGIISEDDIKLVKSLIKKIPGINDHTFIDASNDVENALYSGRCFFEGIALICGTGSVAYGKDLNGTKARAGGWSFKEGDLGSAYDLGMKAIRHVVKAYDGRLDQDDFSLEIAQSIGLNEAIDIVSILNEKYLERTWIASLAPMVTKHANLKNKYAMTYVDQATDDLKLMVQAVYKKLSLSDKRVVVIGSLGLNPGYFNEQLMNKIKSIDLEVYPIEPIIDPAEAAAHMAWIQIHQD